MLQLHENAVPKLTGAWQIQGDAIVLSDTHSPNHSTKWCNRALAAAHLFGIKQLVMVGDGFEFGAFSSWDSPDKPQWSDEQRACGEFFWVLYHSFDKIWWVTANHEARVGRQSGWQVRAKEVMLGVLYAYAEEIGQKFEYDGGSPRIEFSDFAYSYLGDDWLLYHPHGKGNANPRMNANKIALREQRHVAVAHHHICGEDYADDGIHRIAYLGYMGDPEKIHWRRTVQDPSRRWVQGFAIYKDGALTNLAPHSNWERIDELI